MADISIIIRTYCEEKYIFNCLNSIFRQKYDGRIEVIIVDSESTDKTLNIAKLFEVKIISITKREFTFGKSLNIAINNSNGDFIVVISAHCVPVGNNWLTNLIEPLKNKRADLVFGAQLSDPLARCSEFNYFKEKYNLKLANNTKLQNYFNNANSAFTRDTFYKNSFDESIGAQEDIFFAQKSLSCGKKIQYVDSAKVIHYHNFTNKKLFKRIYLDSKWNTRLGVLNFEDFMKSFLNFFLNIFQDLKLANQKRKLLQAIPGIICFRIIEIYSFNIGIIVGLKQGSMK